MIYQQDYINLGIATAIPPLFSFSLEKEKGCSKGF
jgi:hypothetical protein